MEGVEYVPVSDGCRWRPAEGFRGPAEGFRGPAEGFRGPAVTISLGRRQNLPNV